MWKIFHDYKPGLSETARASHMTAPPGRFDAAVRLEQDISGPVTRDISRMHEEVVSAMTFALWPPLVVDDIRSRKRVGFCDSADLNSSSH